MNETSAGVVVAGAGAARHSAARTLRQEGYTGPLTVLHHEAHAPYNRTLVNKSFKDADALLTTFHEPAQQSMTAAAAFGASRELLALRGQLNRP